MSVISTRTALEDVFSRKIIDWAMGSQPTALLVKQALAMALARRQPPTGTLHHSDCDSQDASERYRRLLTEHRLSSSMSRTGNCLDNTMMESFFATLKSDVLPPPSHLVRLPVRLSSSSLKGSITANGFTRH